MGAKTGIAWCDSTWTPLRARVREDAERIAIAKGYTSLVTIGRDMAGRVGPHCEHVSHGCDNCYAESNNGRCLTANGTGLPFDRRARDLVEPFVDEKILEWPLRWKKPRKIFVCSQTDLFGEWVTDEAIDRVFAVMALCLRHTFQILTKRPERMLKYLIGREDWIAQAIESRKWAPGVDWNAKDTPALEAWPLPNIWLGVSVEDQATADERIPLLLLTPASKRFISYEPALSAVDFYPWLGDTTREGAILNRGIDWVIIGGESGGGARPFDIEWAHETIMQCDIADIACFYKQGGASNACAHSRSGEHFECFPEALQVREFPV